MGTCCFCCRARTDTAPKGMDADQVGKARRGHVPRARTCPAQHRLVSSGSPGLPRPPPLRRASCSPVRRRFSRAEPTSPAAALEAFRVPVRRAGLADSVQIYVDAGTTARRLGVGLVADHGNSPGARLVSGSLSAPRVGGWDTVPLSATRRLVAGQAYWLSISARGGPLHYRSRRRTSPAQGIRRGDPRTEVRTGQLPRLRPLCSSPTRHSRGPCRHPGRSLKFGLERRPSPPCRRSRVCRSKARR